MAQSESHQSGLRQMLERMGLLQQPLTPERAQAELDAMGPCEPLTPAEVESSVAAVMKMIRDDSAAAADGQTPTGEA